MKYSIEIGKIIEGSLNFDKDKVINYTNQLIAKLENDEEIRASKKFKKLLNSHYDATLSAMNFGISNNIPVDEESRTSLADIIYPSANNVDIVLSQVNFDKIQTFILNYKSADKLNKLGIGVSNTLLLSGPPGCGKTLCAYEIAKKLELPLVIARLDSMISSFLGTTAKNIRILFEFTQKFPCVLFLDEFDAIAKARDDNNELGELKRVVNSLLQNIDSFNEDSLLLAATNHEQLLDSAIWRRFDYKLEIELPDLEARKKLIKLFLKDSFELTDKNLLELATAFTGLSGASIESIIKNSIRKSVIYNKTIKIYDIFEELFIFKKIIQQNITDKKIILTNKAKFLRNTDEKVFSFQAIADILECSKSHISKLIKEG